MTELPQIELLESHKENAHLRLQDHLTPSLWSYAVEWYKQKRELYNYNGFLLCEFWYHSSNDIPVGEGPIFQGLDQIAQWANRAYINWRRQEDRPGGNLCFRFVCRPDGQWMVSECGWGPWVVPDLSKKDQDGKTGYDFKPWQGVGHNRWAWNLNCKRVELPSEISALNEVFEKAWRDARQKYRKVLHETGEARQRHENILDENHVKRTQIRMEVAAQASKAKDLLDVYLKSVNDETMTVAQIGELYQVLTELGSLNLTMKKVYGGKMPKK